MQNKDSGCISVCVKSQVIFSQICFMDVSVIRDVYRM